MFKTFGGIVALTQKGKKALEREFLNAVVLGKVNVVTKCIKKGVDINVYDPENEKYTALHICAEKGDNNIAKVLIDQKNLNMNAQSTFLNTPLMVAVIYNMLHFVRLLLRNGANPNIKNYAGSTALHLAVQRDYHMVVELLSYKAHVNVVDEFDNTPLSLCIIEHPSRLIAKCLLKNGANPNLRTMKANPLLLELCLNCYSQEHLQLVRLLLEFNADPNIINRISKQTPLHMASIIGSVLLAKLLIKMGANPKQKDLLNRTPMDVAIDHDQTDLISYYKFRKAAKIVEPVESESKMELKSKQSILSITSGVFKKSRKSVKFTENRGIKTTDSDDEEMYLQHL